MNLAFLFLAAVVYAGPPQAAEHPVPLPADVDATQCAECHAEKQQGKHVHTAISMGCTTCHSVETKDGSTRISLTAPPEELCLTCHELAKAENEGVLHRPYEQKRCIVCHDPHSSDFNAQTRAPMNNLCLACHGERVVTGETVELFGPKKLDAAEFNQIPKIGLDRGQRTGHPFLEHPVTGKSDPLSKGQPMSCLTCHQPHAAPLPKLLDNSWRQIEICDKCHEAARADEHKEQKEPKQEKSPTTRQNEKGKP